MEHYKLYSSYLSHSRTKGSKNGERKYQYEDGTYTELGKERRRKGGDQFRGSDSDDDDDDDSSDSASQRSAKSETNYRQAQLDMLNFENKYDKALATYKENRKKENVSPVQKQLESLQKTVNGTSNFFGGLGKLRDNRINADAKKKAAEAVKTMSTSEINEIVNRIDAENKYISRLAPETHKNEERMKKVVSVFGALIGISAGVVGLMHEYPRDKK